jgi:3-phosphoshikimate 1-carboxyvinyltransferase
MEAIVSPAKKIAGQISVPGEREPAERALVLAALSEGDSVVRNAPVAAGRVVALLRELGVDITERAGTYAVRGVGLRGFQGTAAPIDLEGLGDTVLLLLPLLAGQTFRSRVKLGTEAERCRPLIDLLAQLGLVVEQEHVGTFVTGGQQAKGCVFSEAPTTDALALGVMVGALFAEGTTALKSSRRVERLLRGHGVAVERRKLLSVEGGQALQATDVEVPGQLALAYPLMGAALCRKRSELTIKRVAIRPGQRAFLDLLRQIGAQIAAENREEATRFECDLHVCASQLKATRVAGARAAKVADQIALLAVLATQTMGTTVIRDVEGVPHVEHLCAALRSLGARIGQFPEGLVVKGGFPLQGGQLDGKGDPGLTMAFAVAGLLAEGELTIQGSECLTSVWPDFFKTVQSIRGD